jgi:AcrR family transcriptional regulator
MSTRDTQDRILKSALQLFNKYGSAAISSNRIAEHCGVSKGNLHYHYRTKRDIVFGLFQQIVDEMNPNWYRDHLDPTLEHMAEMFLRQLKLILKYRFFYREMAELMRRDEILRRRFAETRARRVEELMNFFTALAQRGLMSIPDYARMTYIVDVTWIVSDSWLNYLDYDGRKIDADSIIAGYHAILEVLRPYLCRDPQEITLERYQLIGQLGREG